MAKGFRTAEMAELERKRKMKKADVFDYFVTMMVCLTICFCFVQMRSCSVECDLAKHHVVQ
jgi:hypothetical protein